MSLQDYSVCVVGGLGRMGRWAADLLTGMGFPVSVTDAASGPLDRAAVEAAGIIILATPVAAAGQVMATIGPWTRPDQLIMDLGSLKEEPCRRMSSAARCPAIGLHPMFGPSAQGLEGQLIFMCRATGGLWVGRIKAWLEGQGAKVVLIDPQRHDRLMAMVQSLRHLMLAALGRTLEEEGFAPLQDGALAGPWFNQLLGLMALQDRQPAELYADLAVNNPHAAEVMAAFSGQVARMSDLVAQGKSSDLAQAMSPRSEPPKKQAQAVLGLTPSRAASISQVLMESA